MNPSKEKTTAKNYTILVIEDAEDLRSDVLEMLKMEGYKTSGAPNGKIGVEMANDMMPDLIVCDIMMPELDGFGVLQALRSDAGTAAIPFIFLTAKTEHINQRQGMVLGADDFLTKPFMAEELLESIEAQLKKREDQLEAVNRRIDSLTKSIALALPHELRTPLNTVIGFSEMLQSEAQNLKPDQVAGWANHIHSAGFRLYDVVENYLMYIRLELQAQNSAVSLTDIPPLDNFHMFVNSQSNTVAQQAKRTDDLTIEVEPAPAILISEEHANKIIEELVDNAFKFSTKGKPVHVKGSVDGEHYVLIIQDQGRGMSPDQIKEINAFMQFERSYYEHQGLGLGLALVKRICEIYDINFEMIGEKEQGITITVRFKAN